MAHGPVHEVVLGVADVGATVDFLRTFDLVEVDAPELDPAAAELLVGRPCTGGSTRRLASPLAPRRASVLVVPTSEPASEVGAWETGPRALDIYSADLDRSIEAFRAAGWEASPEAVIAGGPMRMRQVLVRGPEGLPVVLVDSTHRRSSVCDLPAAPLHSEPHSVVWCVDAHAEELARWAAAGWTAGATVGFSEPTVSDELGLPERPTPVTMTMLSDEDVAPVRVELLTFDDHDGTPGPPAALAAVLVRVPDVAVAAADWGDGAEFGPVVGVAGVGDVASGTTAGGVRIVLAAGGGDDGAGAGA